MPSPEKPSPPDGLHTIEGFTELPLPLRPELAELFGYHGNARFVGFHWEAAGDDLYSHDGIRLAPGAGRVFEVYRNHPNVAPVLEPHGIGYSDIEADSLLLLDRQQSLAGVAPTLPATTFLQMQHPIASPPTAEQREAESETVEEAIRSTITLEGFRDVPVDMGAVMRVMQQQNEAINFLLAYLDQWPEV